MDGENPMPTGARLDTRLTYDHFVLFPDDGLRHEIIDGVHYVTPSPTRRHQRVSRRLSSALDSYLSEHPSAGEMFYAPFDVVLSHWDVVEPVYRRAADGAFPKAAELTAADRAVLTTPILPDFRLELEPLFA